jgi:hypothetical protein
LQRNEDASQHLGKKPVAEEQFATLNALLGLRNPRGHGPRRFAAEIAPAARRTGLMGLFNRLDMRAIASSTPVTIKAKANKIPASVAADFWLIRSTSIRNHLTKFRCATFFA